MKKIITLLVFLSLSVFATTFSFTAIPDQDETGLKKRFSKLSNYLSKKLQVKVKFIPVKSYVAAISAFRNNQVQLAWFGGLSGVRARLLTPNSKAIAQGESDTKFYSYFIANKKANLKKSDTFPKQIKGKTFLFGPKGSTSGRLMPEYYIRKHLKKNPYDIFNKVGFSQNHSKTIALVQSGAYEVGAVNFKVWDKELKLGKIDTSKVSVIYKTPIYPDYQFSIRGDVEKTFGKGFITKVQKAILEIDDKDILSAFPRNKFIKATNSDFTPVLKTAREIGLIYK